MTLSSQEVEKRAPVWEALAELFVGKELQEYDYQYIARSLRNCGYPTDVLETILRDEVTPVFRSNIGVLSIPEMEGWSGDTIKSAVLDHLENTRLASRIRSWLRPQAPRPPTVVQDRWDKVKRLLTSTGQLPAA